MKIHCFLNPFAVECRARSCYGGDVNLRSRIAVSGPPRPRRPPGNGRWHNGGAGIGARRTGATTLGASRRRRSCRASWRACAWTSARRKRKFSKSGIINLIPDIVAHAQPTGIRKGTLFVTVDSSVWLDEIVRYRRREILERLQNSFGRDLITRISFRTG